MRFKIDELDLDIDVNMGKIIGSILVVFLVIAALVFVMGCWVVIPAGQVGVGDFLGTVSWNEFNSGFHLKNPIEKINFFDAQTQKFEADDIKGNTIEGLEIAVHITVNYHIDQSKADEIYKTLGNDYREKIVTPQIRGAIYDEIGKYTAEKLYKERNVLSGPAKEQLNAFLNPRGIYIETVTIRGVILPDKLKQAIEEKQTMEQDIQKKRNEVDVATAEADRKRVEAQGIADANEIIAQKLTKEYLQWYWIENVAGKDNTIYVPTNGIVPVYNV